MSLKRLRLQPKKGDSGSYAFDSIIAYKAVFRIRVFFPDPDQTFFLSGSGSAKNPDLIRKNPDSWKNVIKLG